MERTVGLCSFRGSNRLWKQTLGPKYVGTGDQSPSVDRGLFVCLFLCINNSIPGVKGEVNVKKSKSENRNIRSERPALVTLRFCNVLKGYRSVEELLS